MKPGYRSRRIIFLVLTTLAWQAGFSYAQFLGAISGTVRDESGAVLPAATITVTGPALQGERVRTASDEEGRYYFPAIPAGYYDLEVNLPGFQSQIQREVRVAVNQSIVLDFVLPIAQVSAIVEVTASPPLVEHTRSDLNSRVLTETIDALPLNGRNFEDLIGLIPGVKLEPAGSQGAEFSIFGERGAAVSYVVDGTDNNNPLDGGAFQRLAPEAIQEFEVITTGYEAEFGRAQGGVVNIITRSGTNQWFGSGFLFGRNDTLDSSNVPGQEVPKLERAQWGGILGGPVSRDRAFFFGSFEVLDESRGVNIDRSKIPRFVLEGFGTPAGREDFNVGPRTDGFTGLLKVDFTLNEKNRLHVLANRSAEEVGGEISSPIAGTTALPSAASTDRRISNSFSARDVWNVRPTLVVETNGKFIDGDNGQNLHRGERLEPILHLLRSGFLQTNAPFGGKEKRDIDRFQVTQNLSWFADSGTGDHLLKMGWDWNRITVDGFTEVTNDLEYSAAFLAPNQAEIMRDLFQQFGFGQSAARFFRLSGNPDGSMDLHMGNNDIGLFLQDEWRLRQGLTLNLGIRYDYASLFSSDKNNVAARFGFAWDLGGLHRTVLRAGFGLFFDRNLLAAAATVPELGGIFTRSAFDVVLPRLGFTYTDSLIDLVITSGFPLPGGGRTPPENPAYKPLADLLRQDPLGLYNLLGIQVEDPSHPPVVTADNIQQLSGMTAEEAIQLLKSRFPGTDWAFWEVPGGSIVGNQVLSFFPRGPLDRSRDISRFSEARTPWTRAFNLGIEQQLGRNMVLSANYVHRRSRDLLTRRITNLFDVAPGHPNFGQTTDGGPRINQVTYEGKIDYDGLIVQLQKRFSKWNSFSFSYTLSRARDNLLTGRVGSGFTNNHHPTLDYGPSNQSVPHLFAAHSLLSLPWGLHVSTVAFWRSGDAFNPRGIKDLDGDGLVDQRDIAFPRNSFRTRSFFNLDLRVEKRFRVGENDALGILVEAFNLTNRANVRGVNAVSGPSFGVPNTFFPGRELQIGVRYTFQ